MMLLQDNSLEVEDIKKKKKFKTWIKRIGFWGFLFFLVKGLVWLAVLAGGYFAVK